MQGAAVPDADYGRRDLSVVAFVILVVAWLAVLRLVGWLAADSVVSDDGRLLTTDDVVWALVVPIGAACAFVYLAIAVLGWWRPLLYDPKPVQRWVWAIPIILLVAIVGGINYGELADKGVGFTLALLLAALFVGFSEEGMFRCIGVTTFRRNGFSEGRVALWTSALFGLVHVTNLIGGDSKAFAQAVIVSFAGYFFYLIRRVSRSNTLNSVLHGLFDFTLISSTQILPEGGAVHLGVLLAPLVYVVVGILVLVKRHHIEPVGPDAPAMDPVTA